MSLQASTGLRGALLSALKTSLDGGKLLIFSGSKPANADAAIGSATLLCTITDNDTGGGLTFDTGPSNGIIVKLPSQSWRGTNVASGVATFYRHVASGDDGISSASEPRLQGTVGVSGTDLNLTGGTTLTQGIVTPVDTYSIELPAGG
jgi:hypothetical protein